MNDSGTIASWLQVGVGFVALILFIIVERNNLIPIRSTKSPSTAKNRRRKGSTSIQASELAETEDVDIRLGIYSRVLVGIIFGITLANVYVRISNYFQHSFSRNEIAVAAVAIPISLTISFVYDRPRASVKSFFVHWTERLVIVYGYLYIISTYVYCDSYGELPHECHFVLWERALVITAIFMILISYPSTPIDWLLKSVKKTNVNNMPTS